MDKGNQYNYLCIILNLFIFFCYILNIGLKSLDSPTFYIIEFLKKNKIKIISTLIKNSVDYTSVKFTGPCAIIVGTESSTLSDDWINISDKLINIPMKGKMDSLNLSVTAAIVIFEALKQRNAN